MIIKSIEVECDDCKDEAVYAFCEGHFKRIKEEEYDAGYFAGYNAGKKSDEPSEDKK